MDYKIKDLEDKGQKIRFKVWDTNSEKKKENVLKSIIYIYIYII